MIEDHGRHIARRKSTCVEDHGRHIARRNQHASTLQVASSHQGTTTAGALHAQRTASQSICINVACGLVPLGNHNGRRAPCATGSIMDKAGMLSSLADRFFSAFDATLSGNWPFAAAAKPFTAATSSNPSSHVFISSGFGLVPGNSGTISSFPRSFCSGISSRSVRGSRLIPEQSLTVSDRLSGVDVGVTET
jgi:hypothetical protein